MLSGGGTLNGSYSVASGATLELAGGTPSRSTAPRWPFRMGACGSTCATVNQVGILAPSGAGALELSNGTLNVGGSVDVVSFNQSGGTLGGTGTVTVSGASSLSTPGFSSATMTGTGTTRFDGALSVTGAGLHDFAAGRRLLTTGTTTWTNSSGNGGQFRLGVNAVIENRGLWLDNTSVSTSINGGLGGGTYVNTASGTYRKTGGTTTTISTVMNNDGLVEIQNGVLELGGGGTHTGDFVMSGPGVLSVTAGVHNFLASSSITGANFTFGGGTLNMGGSYDISGTTAVTNGTHSLASANVVNLGPTLNISGGSLDLGALSPTVTSFNHSGGTLGGTGTVTVSGASSLSTPGFSSATMTGTGTTRFDGALSVTGAGLHDFTAGRRLLTTGTTTWDEQLGQWRAVPAWRRGGDREPRAVAGRHHGVDLHQWGAWRRHFRQHRERHLSQDRWHHDHHQHGDEQRRSGGDPERCFGTRWRRYAHR
jgi:fibronectin-binding autotransporter adhesin